MPSSVQGLKSLFFSFCLFRFSHRCVDVGHARSSGWPPLATLHLKLAGDLVHQGVVSPSFMSTWLTRLFLSPVFPPFSFSLSRSSHRWCMYVGHTCRSDTWMPLVCTSHSGPSSPGAVLTWFMSWFTHLFLGPALLVVCVFIIGGRILDLVKYLADISLH